MRMWHWTSNARGIDGLGMSSSLTPVPAPGQVLIKTEYVALNFSDLLMIDDRYQVAPPRPFTPGQELAGTVVAAAGDGPWTIGDRVATKVEWGAFAEFVCVRADMPIAIPDGVDLATSTALPVSYTTAMVALGRADGISEGTVVLVHAAAGAVGLASVEIAKTRGATVIATAGGQEKLQLIARHGADFVFDYGQDDWIGAVKKLTHGKGANIIVDPVGGAITEKSLHCIARDGVLLIVGFASGSVPKIPAHRLLLKRASAKGIYWSHDYDGAELKRISSELVGLLAAGQIKPEIDLKNRLTELPDALARLAGRQTAGKVVLAVDPLP